MNIIKTPLIVFAGLFFITQPLLADSVEYCENLSKKLYQYQDAETAYQDLILKTRRQAVEKVFSHELEAYQRDYFTKDEVIDSILPLVEFDDIKKNAPNTSNAFDVCINLENIRLQSNTDLERFKPTKIAEVCHFDQSYVDSKISEINTSFIKNLQSGSSSPSIKLMLNEPDNIKPQTAEQIGQFIYSRKFDANASYLPKTHCKALYVHPIDLYIASSPRKISSTISLLPPVSAEDSEGNKAKFQIVIINRDYNWKKGSTDIVEKNNKENKGFVNTFKNPRFIDLSKKHLRDIVSLGMASCEGDSKRENKRARARAQSVFTWVKSAFTADDAINIYGINLGKHKLTGKKCKAISSEMSISQRSIILVGILKGSDANIELSQAIYNALRNVSLHQPEKLPTNPKDYLQFEILDRPTDITELKKSLDKS